jgi:hypothetical protein
MICLGNAATVFIGGKALASIPQTGNSAGSVGARALTFQHPLLRMICRDLVRFTGLSEIDSLRMDVSTIDTQQENTSWEKWIQM